MIRTAALILSLCANILLLIRIDSSETAGYIRGHFDGESWKIADRFRTEEAEADFRAAQNEVIREMRFDELTIELRKAEQEMIDAAVRRAVDEGKGW